MDPRLRFWIIVTLAVIVSLVAAFDIADGRYLVPAIAGTLFLWMAVEWLSPARPEAWVLAIAIALPFFVAARRRNFL